MVSKVKQLNGYTCVLACVESLLLDKGLQTSQEALIELFPIECNKNVQKGGSDITGSVNIRDLPDLLKKSGAASKSTFFKGTQGLVQAMRILKLNNKAGGILIVPKKNINGDKEHHCVRLAELHLNSHIMVMDPFLAEKGLQRWEWDHVDKRDCRVGVILW